MSERLANLYQMKSTPKDYSGAFIYTNNILESVNIAGGRILVNGNSISYEHHITDHLGNVRVSFTDTDGDGSGDIVESHHYYPFGGTMDGMHYINGTMNPYRYQGKEFEGEEGYQMHDFGLRMYDSQLGRWHTTDPANQYVSPYLAMGNNPVSMIDPTGSIAGYSYSNSYEHIAAENRRLHNQLYHELNTPSVFVDGVKVGGPGAVGSGGGGLGASSSLNSMMSMTGGEEIRYYAPIMANSFEYSDGRLSQANDYVFASEKTPNGTIYSNSQNGQTIAIGVGENMYTTSDTPITDGGACIDMTPMYFRSDITVSELNTYANMVMPGMDQADQAGGGVNPSVTGGVAAIGGMVGAMEDAYKYGDHTVRYAQRINGKVVNAIELTLRNEAHAAKMASGLKVVGRGVSGLSIATAGYQFAASDMSGNDYARLTGSLIITGTAFIPIVGPVISIGLGVADAYGAFDGVYNYFE